MAEVIVDWPDELPQRVQQDQFSFEPTSGMIRDETDTGYPIVRKRYTATIDNYSIAMVMTYAQFNTFRNFFNNSPGHPTLPGVFGGSVRVNFPDPLWSPGEGETEGDRPSATFRWRMDSGSAPYNVVPDGNSSQLMVSFVLERLP